MKTWPWRPNSEGGRKTLLHLASEAGWAEGVDVAMGEGRQGVFQQSRQCKKKNQPKTIPVLSRIPINAKDEDGRTALHLASSASVAKVLIDGGASAVAQDKACWVSPPLAKVQTQICLMPTP